MIGPDGEKQSNLVDWGIQVKFMKVQLHKFHAYKPTNMTEWQQHLHFLYWLIINLKFIAINRTI